MRNNFKLLTYLLVAIGFSSSFAGSYEDFFVAIKRDDARVVAALLSRGFDPDTRSPESLGGLYLALRDGSLESAQVLIKWPKTNIEIRTAQDESPLMIAALKGQLEIARMLIARDADVNKTGWTPLHYAATNGHLPVMGLLLENHAYIDAESPNGTTPLMMAAQYGSPAAVKLLLDSGADPSLKNQLGLTAVDFALRAHRSDAAELILASLQERKKKYNK